MTTAGPEFSYLNPDRRPLYPFRVSSDGRGNETRFGYVVRRSFFKTMPLPNDDTGFVTG